MKKNVKLFIKTFTICIIVLLILISLSILKKYMILKSINNHTLEAFSDDSNYQVTINTDWSNQKTIIYYANSIMKAEQYSNNELDIVYWKDYNTNEMVYKTLNNNRSLDDFDYKQWLIEAFSIDMNARNPIDYFNINLKSKDNTYILEGLGIKTYYDKVSKQIIKSEMPAPKSPEDKEEQLVITTYSVKYNTVTQDNITKPE